jgi:LmbE family N-acetylglucosaminyl deacetylase
LLQPAEGLKSARSVIVAAHPDDEAIGLGARLRDLRRLASIVHLTDGAPRDGTDARTAGCANWREYAAMRRKEFETALAASQAQCRRNLCLEFPDQQASFHIAELATTLARLFRELRPKVVYTHSYEGGHPDHDAAAAAVYAARRLCGGSFSILEFASYHAGEAGLESERFLEHTVAVDPRPLSAEQRRHKQKIFECYASQRHVLQQFPLTQEPVRSAPEYDFSRPPHAGVLFYEQAGFRMDSGEWRALAHLAFRQLGITPAANGALSSSGSA